MLGQLELKKIDNQKKLKHRVVGLERSIADVFPGCKLDALMGALNAFFKYGDNDGYIYYVDDVTAEVIESIDLFEGVLTDLADDVNSSKYKEMVLDVIGWNLEYYYLTSGSDNAP